MNDDIVYKFTNGSILKMTKPPIDITPQEIWIEQRGKEILEAINRYYEWNGLKAIPETWIKELLSLQQYLDETTKKDQEH